MSKKLRLDVLLVERGLQESRQKAQALIMAGQVYVKGQKVDKAGTPTDPDSPIELRGEGLKYVSRGGLKLEKAMEKLGVSREETVYIGDSEVDIATAKAANVACISVLWGFREKEELENAGAARF